jgi:hypothetical protein
LVQEYGEAVEFWTWDRQPLETFMKLATMSQSGDGTSVLAIVKTLILDEEGHEIISDEAMLPTQILMAAISKLTTTLGK